MIMIHFFLARRFFGIFNWFDWKIPIGKQLAQRCNPGHLSSMILKDLGSLKKTGTCFFSESLGYQKLASEEWGGTEPKKTTCDIPLLLVAYYRPSEWLSITSEYTCVKWFPIYPKQPESSSLLVWIFQSGGTKLKLETWNERPIERILKPPQAMENKTQLGIPAKFSCKTRALLTISGGFLPTKKADFEWTRLWIFNRLALLGCPRKLVNG